MFHLRSKSGLALFVLLLGYAQLGFRLEVLAQPFAHGDVPDDLELLLSVLFACLLVAAIAQGEALAGWRGQRLIRYLVWNHGVHQV